MTNSFIKTAETEIIPRFEQIGAKLVRKTPNEISFTFKKIEISIYLERAFEVYGAVSSPELNKSVYLSELMSDYFNTDVKSTYQISERYSLELFVRKLVDIIIIRIFPLIENGKIFEAMNTVMVKREEGLRKYNEGLIEREAEKAFKEKRYVDVISHYSQISELNDIQRKRLEISEDRIGN